VPHPCCSSPPLKLPACEVLLHTSMARGPRAATGLPPPELSLTAAAPAAAGWLPLHNLVAKGYVGALRILLQRMKALVAQEQRLKTRPSRTCCAS
jgi:hypothetical protein